MSTSVQPTPSEPTSPTAAASPSPAAPTGTASSTPSEFRYGADAPSWAQGKTAQEVLGIAQQLEGVVRQHIQAPAPQPQRDPNTGQFAPAFQPPAPSTPAWDETNYMTGADIRREAPRMISEAINPQINAVYESLAQTNLDNVRRAHSTIFEKYGPEVYAYVAKLPIQARTVDNLTTVVKLVRADHVDEIARVQAVQLAAEMEPTLRSNGSPSVPVAQAEPKNTLQSDLIPQDWKDRAAAQGLTEATVAEFCRANEMSPADFYGQFGKTAITEVTRRG